MAATAAVAADIAMGDAASPRASMEQALHSLNNGIDSIRADPDAQATVTDFLDFAEYLPADIVRSLTLIGKLDERYCEASTTTHNLVTTWSDLPNLRPETRPAPVPLRSEIAEQIQESMSSRIYAHAEASRMVDNITRHHNRAKTILARLKTMLDNFPTAEEQQLKSPVATSKAPPASRTSKAAGAHADGRKRRRQRQVPRIIVPGEVLAPYEFDMGPYSSGSEASVAGNDDDEMDVDDEQVPVPGNRATSVPRIKLVGSGPKPPKAPKIPKRTAIPPGMPMISTSVALAQLKPPPEGAVIGSDDLPWCQLTAWELAKLRKRMKKNASWAPSETMIARELKALGRGLDAYKAAKVKAEEEGQAFDGKLPGPVPDDSGYERMPPGSLSMDSLAGEERNLNNRGVKLNVAKKLKREQLAKLAAEEAEESARKMLETARAMFDASQPNVQDPSAKATTSKVKQSRKRKRESVCEADADAEKADGGDPALQQSQPQSRAKPKRAKTETPVLPPNPNVGAPAQETPMQGPQVQRLSNASSTVPQSTTPIPLPVLSQDHNNQPAQGNQTSTTATSPVPSGSGITAGTVTTLVPVKAPAETAMPTPARETRKSQAARKQDQQKENLAPINTRATRTASPAALTPKLEPDALSSSNLTAVDAQTPTASSTRRPNSRGGKASSQEPQASVAADRPRRASTARNTPAPEPAARPATKRGKRPAPGVITRTNSGNNSAVGARKAAPRKKSAKRARGDKLAAAADAAGASDDVDVEVDDEGNVIDPDEPKYCLCNRVSFGTMIQCDNVDGGCKGEWFHLECVGLTDILPRTTKWYCPDCRKLLNIGGRGEVSARGVKA